MAWIAWVARASEFIDCWVTVAACWADVTADVAAFVAAETLGLVLPGVRALALAPAASMMIIALALASNTLRWNRQAGSRDTIP
jgi:hypothetical protein